MSDLNVKLGGQLINRVERCKFLRSTIILYSSGKYKETMENVVSEFRLGHVKWWEAMMGVLYNKKKALLKEEGNF